MIVNIFIGVIIPLLIGLWSVWAYKDSTKQEKTHRWGVDFFKDLDIACGRVICPILAVVSFIMAIVILIVILWGQN